MKHLDLFSGVGGFKYAAEWSGYETVGFSEIEPYPCNILKQTWPHIKNYGDIRTANFTNLGQVDLLTGGFPCQPFSVAGKQRGKEDDRHLWPEMCRVIAQVKPTYILGENVVGIIGMELDNVLSDLEAIGYAAWPIVIPACAVGAPHRRDRVWILGYSKHNGLASSEVRESHSQGSNGNKERQDEVCKLEGSDLSRSVVADTDSEGLQRIVEANREEGAQPYDEQFVRRDRVWAEKWYEAATRFCGMDDGIPNRSHRLKALGNSIVPQVAYQILKHIPHTPLNRSK